MMKKLGWFSVPILIVASLVILWLMKPIFLSSFLTSRLGVQVVVGSIDLGKIKTTIGNFRIENPIGYKSKDAFKADKTNLTYQWKKLFGKVCEIDQIEIDQIFLSVEFDGPTTKRNNWTAILSKLPKRTHKEKQLIIHRLILTNLTIEIRGLGLSGTQTQTVDSIELDEINSENGFPTAELVRQIFGGAGIEEYLQDLINPANTIRKLLSPPF